MSEFVRSELDSMIRLRIGLHQTSQKYASEGDLTGRAANFLQDASETNSHERVADTAREIARRLESLGAAFAEIVDGLTPDIERLTALEQRVK